MCQLVADVTEQSFEAEVLRAGGPVLVDFWAEWCGPCRMIAPTVEAVAGSYAGALRVVKVNVDENVSVAQRYGVKGIPTLILFRGGVEAGRLVGAASREAISRLIESGLGEVHA